MGYLSRALGTNLAIAAISWGAGLSLMAESQQSQPGQSQPAQDQRDQDRRDQERRDQDRRDQDRRDDDRRDQDRRTQPGTGTGLGAQRENATSNTAGQPTSNAATRGSAAIASSMLTPGAMRGIDELGKAARDCLMTSSHCLDLGGEHASRRHQTVLIDAADSAVLAACFMSRGSEQAGQVAELAADMLDRCARECERLASGDEMMTRCAESSRRAASAARAMAGEAGSRTRPNATTPTTPTNPQTPGTTTPGSRNPTSPGTNPGGTNPGGTNPDRRP